MPDSYRLTDVPQVGGIKSMLQRINAKITALENAQDTTAFHVVTLNGKTVNFYATSDTTLAPVGTFTIPEDKSLDQLGTEIVENFTFSSLKYPNTVNPNLDGKTVFVLAVKGDDALNPTIKYNFVDASKLVDKYTASDTSITIAGYTVKVNTDPSPSNMLSLTANGLMVDGSGKIDKVTSPTTGNVPLLASDGSITNSTIAGTDVVVKPATFTLGNVVEFASDGGIVDSSIASANILVKLSGATANNIVTLTSDGGIVDSTFRVATDAEFTAMLNEVMPVSGS